MITDEQLSEELEYLSGTDEEAANAKALVKALERKEKTVKAIGFLKAEGTVASREHKAVSSVAWGEHIETYQNAVADSETLENKRNTAALVVEVWRSLQANRRRGNI